MNLTGTATLPRADEFSVDARVLLCALLLGGLAALLFGVLPALRSAQPGRVAGMRSRYFKVTANSGLWRSRSRLCLADGSGPLDPNVCRHTDDRSRLQPASRFDEFPGPASFTRWGPHGRRRSLCADSGTRAASARGARGRYRQPFADVWRIRSEEH